jgi:hypothetical protein
VRASVDHDRLPRPGGWQRAARLVRLPPRRRRYLYGDATIPPPPTRTPTVTGSRRGPARHRACRRPAADRRRIAIPHPSSAWRSAASPDVASVTPTTSSTRVSTLRRRHRVRARICQPLGEASRTCSACDGPALSLHGRLRRRWSMRARISLCRRPMFAPLPAGATNSVRRSIVASRAGVASARHAELMRSVAAGSASTAYAGPSRASAPSSRGESSAAALNRRWLASISTR